MSEPAGRDYERTLGVIECFKAVTEQCPKGPARAIAEGAAERWHPSPIAYGTTGVLFGGIFVVGLWATPVLEVADDASAVLFG